MILIAGPCVIESEEELTIIIESILKSIQDKDIDFYFKASFKKDNRTAYSSFNGLKEDIAINLLRKIKEKYHVKVCTDVHTVSQISKLDFVDLIQVPAFLAKQQSLLLAIAEKLSGRKIHVKKPQFIAPEEISFIAEILQTKIRKDQIIFSDRGTCLGYDKYFMDPRSIPIMKKYSDFVLWDITHPTKNYKFNGDVEVLAASAMVSGASGLFLETHYDCKHALCDKDTMLPISRLPALINECYSLYQRKNKN